ncbi:MAG: NAD-dependent epimerase/dehydratase family protein [Thermonemataceae bacterium]|nr:NAD-dependent epimerase/dehydratase family protein [Thermonemataceae bacterium]
MQKVFITGATGLVGAYLTRSFVEKGYSVKALKRPQSAIAHLEDLRKIQWIEGDILDILTLENAIEPEDIVVHAAAVVSFNKIDKIMMQKINIEGTANMVNIALEKNIKKFIHISSIASLGRKKGQTIIDETSQWEDSELNTIYAETKYLAELEVWRAFSEGLQGVILNPSLVFGVGDWNKSSLQIFKYVAQNKKMYPLGDANYIDLRTIAEAVLAFAENDITNERFILNAGSLPYKVLFEKIAEKIEKKPPHIPITPFIAALAWRLSSFISFFTRKKSVITKETALSSQKKFFYDNKKIKNALPDLNFYDIDETISWVVSEYNPNKIHK